MFLVCVNNGRRFDIICRVGNANARFPGAGDNYPRRHEMSHVCSRETTGGNNRGQQQGATKGGNNRRQQQEATTGGNNRRHQQGATTGGNNRGQQQGATTGGNNRGQQQRATTGGNNRVQQQGNNRGQQQGATTGGNNRVQQQGNNRGQQQGATTEGNNRGQQQEATTGGTNRGQQQEATTGGNNRGQQQRATTGGTPPGDNLLSGHWSCRLIGLVGSLVLSTHWSCRLIGLVDSLVLSTHWSCRLIGLVGSLVLSTHWSCRLIGLVGSLVLSAHWSCRLIGLVGSLVLSAHWSCRLIGLVDSLVLSGHWYCRFIYLVGSLVLSAHWSCRLIGLVDSLVLSAHWSSRVIGLVGSLVLSTHWSCWLIGLVYSLVLSTHLSCRLIGHVGSLVLSAHWSCRLIGLVGSLVLSAHWSCRLIGLVGSLVLSAHWSCRLIGLVGSLVLSAHWSCRLIGLVDSLVLSAHWSCRLNGLVDSLVLSDNCHHQGALYEPGSTMSSNCNNCTCTDVAMTDEYNWQCTQKICLIRPDLLDLVSAGSYGWKPAKYPFFWGMTLAEGVQYRLGTFEPLIQVKRMSSLRGRSNVALRSSFDARRQWPGLVHPIMDQGNCASSWAFSTISVASDRLSIHSGGALRQPLSPQNLISCNTDSLQRGCEGGHLGRAWWYMRHKGVVSEACYPYESGDTSQAGHCRLRQPVTHSRARVLCPSNGRTTSKVFQASPPYRISPNEREIMKEITVNGPVQATMLVKEDFYMYRSGVYRYSMPADYLAPNHRRTGFHSVKIIGWGNDYSSGRPLKYWLCANSWGRRWGEDGYFRIQRGTNECRIESFVIGAWGRVHGRTISRPQRRRPRHVRRRHAKRPAI
ncbi:putative peptidase C1-like protein F26E4.3 [Lamellibrachia satsuma]|nr:putative peptidase C1-like protein F26E4.3 [Lamellibrachia satsuma]